MPNWAISFLVFVAAQLIVKVFVGTYLESRTKHKAPQVAAGAYQVSSVIGLIIWGAGFPQSSSESSTSRGWCSA